jgi:2'-5' RNA ligase
MASDQAAFLAQIQDYRIKGAEALLADGVQPDPHLIQELSASGSDQRHGVNLIARPPPPIVSCIQAIQERLREREPDQYYYPVDDLHLTLIEFCSSRTRFEVEILAATVAKALPEMVRTAPEAVLARPLLGYDQRACALNFLPTDESLQQLRRNLTAQLADHGATIAPRYVPQSAHVTLMRYIRPLQTDSATWVGILQAALSDTPEWRVDTIWLAWGATWYGLQNRIEMRGPYRLGHTES